MLINSKGRFIIGLPKGDHRIPYKPFKEQSMTIQVSPMIVDGREVQVAGKCPSCGGYIQYFGENKGKHTGRCMKCKGDYEIRPTEPAVEVEEQLEEITAPEIETPTAKATELLEELHKLFTDAPRAGRNKDKPEGSRYITISDTLAWQLANKIARQLRE